MTMTKRNKSGWRVLGWLLLLGLGFLGGVAWTGRSTASSDKQPSASSTAQPVNYTGETSSTPADAGQDFTAQELATIRLFESAAPSVCFITTTNVRRDYFTRNITEIPRGSGSAFVWDKEGHIVTNFHVIQGADKAQVTLADGSSWEATLVGKAPEKDLAVLRIDAPAKALRPIPVGSSERLRVGQSVYAIGNPFGLDQSLTTGVVSALGREIKSVAGIPIRDVIQSDAAINPGNSGGPLLDSSGRLIGVNTAIYSPSGTSAGIGFSIPADVVSWVVPELIKYGKLKRPTLGVELARQLRQIEGALILDVIGGSAAEKVGLRPTYTDRYGRIILGDIIVSLNGEAIKSNNDLFLALEKYNPGDKVRLRIRREDQELEVPIVLDIAQ